MSGMSFAPSASRAVQLASPTTGQTAQMENTIGALLLTPAALLAALTIAVPAAPSNGQEITIGTSQGITVVTMSGGTIIGPLSSLVAGGFATYVYNAANTTWYRTG